MCRTSDASLFRCKFFFLESLINQNTIILRGLRRIVNSNPTWCWETSVYGIYFLINKRARYRPRPPPSPHFFWPYLLSNYLKNRQKNIYFLCMFPSPLLLCQQTLPSSLDRLYIYTVVTKMSIYNLLEPNLIYYYENFWFKLIHIQTKCDKDCCVSWYIRGIKIYIFIKYFFTNNTHVT